MHRENPSNCSTCHNIDSLVGKTISIQRTVCSVVPIVKGSDNALLDLNSFREGVRATSMISYPGTKDPCEELTQV